MNEIVSTNDKPETKITPESVAVSDSYRFKSNSVNYVSDNTVSIAINQNISDKINTLGEAFFKFVPNAGKDLSQIKTVEKEQNISIPAAVLSKLSNVSVSGPTSQPSTNLTYSATKVTEMSTVDSNANTIA